MDRRHFLRGGMALTAGAVLSSCGGGGDGGDAEALDVAGSSSPTAPLPPPAQPKARVIVIGGGMAGVTAAKYLRLWGDAIDVTLVERTPTYTSCILSSLVLTGQRTLASLQFGYATLRDRYGVRTVFDTVTRHRPSHRRGSRSPRAPCSPPTASCSRPASTSTRWPGLTDPLAMPHAWKAGPQTTALAQQLAAMPSSGVAVLTIPKAPYRCPPGPYERACLLADWMPRAQAARQADRARRQSRLRHREGQLLARLPRPARRRHRVPQQCRHRPCRHAQPDAVHRRRRGARRCDQPDPRAACAARWYGAAVWRTRPKAALPRSTCSAMPAPPRRACT